MYNDKKLVSKLYQNCMLILFYNYWVIIFQYTGDYEEEGDNGSSEKGDHGNETNEESASKQKESGSGIIKTKYQCIP